MCSNGELELNESLGIIWWAFVCLYFWQWHLTLAFDRWLERHLRWYLPFFFAAFRPNIHGQRFNRNVIGFDDRLFRLPEIRMFKCAFGDKMNDIHFIANTSDSKSQSKWKKNDCLTPLFLPLLSSHVCFNSIVGNPIRESASEETISFINSNRARALLPCAFCAYADKCFKYDSHRMQNISSEIDDVTKKANTIRDN